MANDTDKLLKTIYLKQKIDEEAASQKLDEKQKKLIDAMHGKEVNMPIKDTSLSTKDSWSVRGGPDKIDTREFAKVKSGSDWQKEILEKLAEKRASKKALSIIPGMGVAAGLMSGDPAMAAEEALGDVPVIGQAYEAIRPDSVGMSGEEENMELAEDKARKAYRNSPAAEARRLALSKVREYVFPH